MRNYKESNEKIIANEELIYKTVEKINERKKVIIPPVVILRRVALGALAMVILVFSSVATYAVVTKDAKILQFFGIKMSENYEKEAVETNLIIKEQTGIIKQKEAEVIMKSFAIDNSFLIMEYNIKLNKNTQCEIPSLRINEFSIYSPYIEENIEDMPSYIPFEFEVEQVAEEIEENQYHIFVILHPTGIKEEYASFTPYGELGLVTSPNAYASSEYNLLDYSYGKYSRYSEEKDGMEYYYSSDTAKFKIVIENMENEYGEIIAEDFIKNETIELEINKNELPKKEECNWKFYTNKIESSYVENGDIKFKLWNIEDKIIASGNLIRGSFANIINVNIYERDYAIDETDIDKIQILVKDENGEEVVQKYYCETLNRLDDGSREIYFTIILDEKAEEQYTIEVIKNNNIQKEW